MNAQFQFHHARIPALLIILASLTISLGATPASAATSPVGTWNVAGNLAVIAKFPQIISSTTTLNAKTLGMRLTYGEDGSFSSSLLGLEGTWKQTGNKVNIDLGTWMSGIKSTVMELLPENTVIDISTASFTATVVSPNKMVGNVKLTLNAMIPAGTSFGGATLNKEVKGKITISGALTNTPAAAAARALGAEATEKALPVDILNRIIGGVFLYNLITR